LLQYVSTKTFYGRVKVDGKLYHESLETDVFSAAKFKLSHFRAQKMLASQTPATQHKNLK